MGAFVPCVAASLQWPPPLTRNLAQNDRLLDGSYASKARLRERMISTIILGSGTIRDIIFFRLSLTYKQAKGPFATISKRKSHGKSLVSACSYTCRVQLFIYSMKPSMAVLQVVTVFLFYAISPNVQILYIVCHTVTVCRARTCNNLCVSGKHLESY